MKPKTRVKTVTLNGMKKCNETEKKQTKETVKFYLEPVVHPFP
jgi:hypothetical protein